MVHYLQNLSNWFVDSNLILVHLYPINLCFRYNFKIKGFNMYQFSSFFQSFIWDMTSITWYVTSSARHRWVILEALACISTQFESFFFSEKLLCEYIINSLWSLDEIIKSHIKILKYWIFWVSLLWCFNINC